jgi:hypothetical protein
LDNNIAPNRRFIFWLSLSLIFSLVYSLLAIQQGWGNRYTAQDDFRVFLVWMQRFVDPSLLKGDLIADYYQAVTPQGYGWLFQGMVHVGIQPLLLSKILPVILGLFTTFYCFLVCLTFLPIPMAGFVGTLLLNQSVWLVPELVSATPRAFLYPLTLAFLYYLLKQSWLPVWITLILSGLFYPVTLLLCAGLLALRLGMRLWQLQRPKTAPLTRSDFLLYGIGLGISLFVILLYGLGNSQFGPTVSLAEARTWPEYGAAGKIPFFDDADPWKFWFRGNHSGLHLALNPPLLGAAFLLPLLMRYPARFAVVKRINPDIAILAQFMFVSLSWFLIAHAIAFKIYLPSRYTQHSWRIVLAIASGIALTVVWQALFNQLKQAINANAVFQITLKTILTLGVTGTLIILLLFYPNLFWQDAFPSRSYVSGNYPELYQFLQAQPKTAVVAGLTDETNNLLAFSGRSVLVAPKYGDPYHVKYRNQFRQHVLDLIQAQYSTDYSDLKTVIEKYNLSFWLLDQAAFGPDYLKQEQWFNPYFSQKAAIIATLEQGVKPALLKFRKPCSVFRSKNLVLLDTRCILNRISTPP